MTKLQTRATSNLNSNPIQGQSIAGSLQISASSALGADQLYELLMAELDNTAKELELLASACSPVLTPAQASINSGTVDIGPPLVDTPLNNRLFVLVSHVRSLRATAEEIRMRIAI